MVTHYVFRLTDREKKDIDYKKNVLKLVTEHKKAGNVEKVDRYYVPKDSVVCMECFFPVYRRTYLI